MDSLNIKGTAHTPEIDFRPDDQYFCISGRAIPADADIYYYPVIKYLQILKKDLIAIKYNKLLTFDFKLIYYNSSSIRYLNTIFQELEIIAQNTKIVVNWYFVTDDEYLEEMGEYFKDMFNINIVLVPIAPPVNLRRQKFL